MTRLRDRHRERTAGGRPRLVDVAVLSRYARPVELDLIRTAVLVAIAVMAILVLLPALLELAPG
jgi:hypothetical protein